MIICISILFKLKVPTPISSLCVCKFWPMENSDRILIGFVRLKNCKMLINMKFLDKSKLAQQPTTHSQPTFLLARWRLKSGHGKCAKFLMKRMRKMHDYIIWVQESEFKLSDSLWDFHSWRQIMHDFCPFVTSYESCILTILLTKTITFFGNVSKRIRKINT